MSLGRLASASRTHLNLAPTVSSSARGVPIAKGINLGALSAGHHGDAGHDHGPDPVHRADLTVPKWSVNIGVGPTSQMRITTPINGGLPGHLLLFPFRL